MFIGQKTVRISFDLQTPFLCRTSASWPSNHARRSALIFRFPSAIYKHGGPATVGRSQTQNRGAAKPYPVKSGWRHAGTHATVTITAAPGYLRRPPSGSPHALRHGHHRRELGALSLCPLKIRITTVRHIRGNTC